MCKEGTGGGGGKWCSNNKDQEPVIGASVMVRGDSRGTCRHHEFIPPTVAAAKRNSIIPPLP